MHVSPTLLVHGFGLLAMGALLYFCSTSPGSVRVLSGMMFQPDIDTSDMAVLGHALRSLSLMMVMVAVVNLKHAFLERAGQMPRSVLLLDIVFAGHFVAESYLYGVGTAAMTRGALVMAAWDTTLLLLSLLENGDGDDQGGAHLHDD